MSGGACMVARDRSSLLMRRFKALRSDDGFALDWEDIDALGRFPFYAEAALLRSFCDPRFY